MHPKGMTIIGIGKTLEAHFSRVTGKRYSEQRYNSKKDTELARKHLKEAFSQRVKITVKLLSKDFTIKLK